MLKKFLDFISDKRFPQYIPYVMLKRIRIKKEIEKTQVNNDHQISIALTFDIEHDFGSGNIKVDCNSVEPFLSKIKKIADKKDIPLTFFVQGNLIVTFSDLLKKLEKTCELGLHGYAHELWGDEKWFLNDQPTSLSQKEELLNRGINHFIDCGLKRPVSFRAPNMVINTNTQKLLEKYDFFVDSSAPSYLGITPIPSKPLGPKSRLKGIPVTVNPVPRYMRGYFVVPYISYEVFNMKSLLTFSDEYFIHYVNIISQLQIASGFSPHLVFLAHPWEFMDEKPDSKDFDYCSSANYDLLVDKLLKLEGAFKTDFVTMKGLYEKL